MVNMNLYYLFFNFLSLPVHLGNSKNSTTRYYQRASKQYEKAEQMQFVPRFFWQTFFVVKVHSELSHKRERGKCHLVMGH